MLGRSYQVDVCAGFHFGTENISLSFRNKNIALSELKHCSFGTKTLLFVPNIFLLPKCSEMLKQNEDNQKVLAPEMFDNNKICPIS